MCAPRLQGKTLSGSGLRLRHRPVNKTARDVLLCLETARPPRDWRAGTPGGFGEATWTAQESMDEPSLDLDMSLSAPNKTGDIVRACLLGNIPSPHKFRPSPHDRGAFWMRLDANATLMLI